MFYGPLCITAMDHGALLIVLYSPLLHSTVPFSSVPVRLTLSSSLLATPFLRRGRQPGSCRGVIRRCTVWKPLTFLDCKVYMARSTVRFALLSVVLVVLCWGVAGSPGTAEE